MAGVNYWVILAAGLASFLFGAIWYGILSKQWMAAIDKSEDELKASAGFIGPMAITITAQLFMAWAETI